MLIATFSPDARFGLLILCLFGYFLIVALLTIRHPRGLKGPAPDDLPYLVDGVGYTEQQLVTMAQREAYLEGRGEIITNSFEAQVALLKSGHFVERVDCGCGCGKMNR